MLFSHVLTCRKEFVISADGLPMSEYMLGQYRYRSKKTNNSIILMPISNGVLYHNSFVPMIQIHENPDGKTLLLKFSLIRSVRIMMTITAIFASTIEVCLLFMWIQGMLSHCFLAVIPVAIFAFSILLGEIIFRGVVRNISSDLQQ